MRLSEFVATAGLVLVTTLSHAQSPGSASEATSHPARGMTMARVESAFGAPTSRAPAIGQPPITRWEYPGFVVYFEHSHVIHTVTVR